MRVLALSPGSLEDQLDRLPALADICQKLNASLQVACDPQQAAPWKLLPCLDKLLPFSFEANPTLADWANLLGCVREPDFQICINFAEGQQVNLMLSMSHIPKRLAVEGFACTDQVSVGPGWTAQRLNPFLQALGLDLKADQFRLPLAAEALEEAREALPSGDGPLLLLSPSGQGNDWPAAEWHQLPETIKSRLPALRSMVLPAELSLPKRAALVANADVVLSSCPVSQRLATYCGTPLVALGGEATDLPERAEIRCLGRPEELATLQGSDVLTALGF